jgi:hypothetical protein
LQSVTTDQIQEHHECLKSTQGGHTVDGKAAINPQPPASEEGEKPAPQATNRRIELLDELVGRLSQRAFIAKLAHPN